MASPSSPPSAPASSATTASHATPLHLKVQPLTPEAFAPYGEIISFPDRVGRTYFEDALGNLRDWAKPSLSTTFKPATPAGASITIDLLERHEFSSQTFIPLSDVRWLIVVCPHHPDGGPDAARSVVFIADGTQGVTYRPDTWHHGLTVLEGEGQFAIFMWRDGTGGDEEFVKIEPVELTLA